MEALILLALLVVVLCLVLPVVAIAKASGARRAVEDLAARVARLEKGPIHETPSPAESPVGEGVVFPGKLTASPTEEVVPRRPEVRPVAVPPPLPVTPPAPVGPVVAASRPASAPKFAPPPPVVGATRTAPVINWEQFMGAKLFAWVGGFALFLGVAFFVKYSFEHNLVPAEIRVAIGFVIGFALLMGGVTLRRKENVVTAQTLSATGILILYAVTFACRSYYHFSFFGLIPTFLLMALITATAFVVAVRMDAMLVAVLGMAGGFLTPLLLSTGQDNPFGLFGYIALLDVGLLMVARRKDWHVLPILGAIGTVLMQMGWITEFFFKEHYFSGHKTLIPMGIFLGFEALFLIALTSLRGESKTERTLIDSNIAIGATAILWTFFFLTFHGIAHRPIMLFGYLFLADLGLLAILFLKKRAPVSLSGAAGVAAFTCLAIWTGNYLVNGVLYVALAAYLLFAVLHTLLPLLLQRARGVAVPWWSHAFPALTLLLVLMPIFNLPDLSFLVWPMILCVDFLAIFLAVTTGLLLPVLVVLLLTFVIIGSWMLRIPLALTGLPSSLSLLGGFAVFFLAVSVWASRKLLSRNGNAGEVGSLFGNFTAPANSAVQIPALSATLPFLLLIMVTLRLPLADPSAVCGLALLLVILLLGMTKLLSLDVLAAVGLGSVLALEHAWHSQHFDAQQGTTPLLWYLGFAAVFTLFPFVFSKQFAARTLVWAVAALAAPLHFFLIYDAIRRSHPNGMLGLVPAVLALPSLLELFVVARQGGSEDRARVSQLALFGGAALFFITLIFPIQFDRQWITIGWALEGAALCWLFRRVPHPGLRLTGIGLLVVAFARLALNPAVLEYHARASTPIFNWYLYAYGLTIISLFVAALLLAPPRHMVFEHDARPLLYSLGTILAFLLLNIEIADYFSTPGVPSLTFQFTGNFARDMSYSIAWAGFALLLLVIGIRNGAKTVRYAGMGLLILTISKLFAHDLWHLGDLYRVGALIIVAIVAMLAGFQYQRLFNLLAKEKS
jgi:uncharacterized membrane protein